MRLTKIKRRDWTREDLFEWLNIKFDIKKPEEVSIYPYMLFPISFTECITFHRSTYKVDKITLDE